MLNRQAFRNGAVALGVDDIGKISPLARHSVDFGNASIVFIQQLFPQRQAGWPLCSPGNVVKPQQEPRIDRVRIVPTVGDPVCMLRQRIRPACSSVETDALRIGAMIVARIPFRARQVADPWCRAVVVARIHEMRQAERSHVADHGFATPHHHSNDLFDGLWLAREGLDGPFACDLFARQFGIPGEAAESVPVGLVEMRAAPVAIRTGVGHACHTRRKDHLGHRPAATGRMVQHFLPHGCKEGQMAREAEIFLRDLRFEHQLRIRHRAEHRMKRLARLEVDRAVLHLDDHIVGKLPVQRHEFAIRLLGPVGFVFSGVNEGTPDDCTPAANRFREHIGTLGVTTPIVLRAGLPLAVRLDEEAAEIGNGGVKLVGLRPPPCPDFRVERVGTFEPANILRRAEPDGNVETNAVRSPRIGQPLVFGYVSWLDHEGAGIDVVDHNAVNTERGIGTSIIDHSLVEPLGQMPPVENRAPGITALDMPIRIVPVIEHAQRHGRFRGDVDAGRIHTERQFT